MLDWTWFYSLSRFFLYIYFWLENTETFCKSQDRLTSHEHWSKPLFSNRCFPLSHACCSSMSIFSRQMSRPVSIHIGIWDPWDHNTSFYNIILISLTREQQIKSLLHLHSQYLRSLPNIEWRWLTRRVVATRRRKNLSLSLW